MFIKHFGAAIASLSVSLGLMGCGSESIGVPNPEQTLRVATMNINAVTLSMEAPYNTVQLSVTAYRGTGEALTTGGVTTYTVSDATLAVTADGLVTARASTVNSNVVARVTYEGVTVTDTTWISVTPGAALAPLETFSISLADTVPVGERTSVTVSAWDTDGTDLSTTIPVHFTTSNPVVATVDRDKVFLADLPERTVTVFATAMVYGVTRTDSLQVTVGYPTNVFVYTYQRKSPTGEDILVFLPNTVYLSAGGQIVFCNCQPGGILPSRQMIDVVFSNPEAAQPGTGSGNIPPWMRLPDNPFSVFQIRIFPTPGTYTFTSPLTGSSGTITVR